MDNVSLTNHAFERITQRVSFNPEVVVEILKRDFFVKVGKEDDIIHCIFYSPYDRRHFVALINEVTGDVVTILPLSFYGDVSVKDRNEALKFSSDIRNMLIEMYPDKEVVDKNDKKEKTEATSFRVSAYCLDGKVVNLGPIQAKPFNKNIQELVNSDEFPDLIKGKLKHKKIKTEDVASIQIKLGKHGGIMSVSCF